MNKSFDCVSLKNELQEKLYNEINVSTEEEYIKELKKSIDNSKWIKGIIKSKKHFVSAKS